MERPLPAAAQVGGTAILMAPGHQQREPWPPYSRGHRGRIERMPSHAPKKTGRSNGNHLSPGERQALLRTLKDRFEKNVNRHKSVPWAAVQARLEADPEKLWSLSEMER